MAQWFRLYESVLDDPKVQRLKPEAFKAWVNILALASRHDGKLPEVADIGFALRVSEEKAAELAKALYVAGLLDRVEDGTEHSSPRYMPHNWASRQFKSDVSNERVKRYRDRHRNAPCNVTETPSESEAETEQIQSSVAKATGSADAATPKDLIFSQSLPWLIKRSGLNDRTARGIVGAWMRDYGDDAVLAALQQAEGDNPIDPVPWIVAKFKPREARETFEQRRLREGRAIIAEEMAKLTGARA